MKICDLGLQTFDSVWQQMLTFTLARDANTPDELWLVEHHPVFTLGQRGKMEHVLNPGDIPVVQTDRGGQVTYHGPGQLVAYVLIDIRRRNLNIRQLVTALEQTVIQLAKHYNIIANSRCDAPGVYVDGAKLSSIGLRIKRGCSYHGLALNVNMDLEPFKRINPCGFADLTMTQLADLGGATELTTIKPLLIEHLRRAIAA